MDPIDLSQRGSIEKGIAGALKSAIAAHGPITEEWVASAAKRVIGAIKQWNKQQRNKQQRNKQQRGKVATTQESP